MVEAIESVFESKDKALEHSIWQRWTLRGATYAPPEPQRFLHAVEGIPRSDIPQVAMATLWYALERSALLKTPEEIGELIEKDDRLGTFEKYCELRDDIWDTIQEAHEFCSELSPEQLKIELPKATKSTYSHPPVRIVREMRKSDNEAFKRVSDMTKSHAIAIYRTMYAWERGITLPVPNNLEIAEEQ